MYFVQKFHNGYLNNFKKLPNLYFIFYLLQLILHSSWFYSAMKILVLYKDSTGYVLVFFRNSYLMIKEAKKNKR